MLSVFILPAMAFADDHGDVPVPAIVIEDEPEQVEDIDWTYRFLIPTTVAIFTCRCSGQVKRSFYKKNNCNTCNAIRCRPCKKWYS